MTNNTSTHHSFPVFSLLFGFTGSSLLGLLIGFVYLLSIPPKPINSRDEKLNSGASDTTPLTHFSNQVTYFRESSLRQNAQALAKKLYASTTNQVEISAMELNAWASACLSPEFNSSTALDKGKSSSISFVLDVPVFHIANHQLHIAYPASIETWGEKWNLLLLSSGDFNNDGMTPDWNIRKLYLNSAPIPFKKFIFRIAKPSILEAMSENKDAKELQTAWKMVKSVSVGDATLAIVRK